MSANIALLLGVVVGAIVGLIAGLFAASGKTKAQQQLREQSEQSLREQLAAAAQEGERWRADATAKAGLEGQLATQTTLASERLNLLAGKENETEGLRQQLSVKNEVAGEQAAQLRALNTELQKERESAEEKLKLLMAARDELKNQFVILAGQILDEKSKTFTDQNKTNLDQLLNPLRTQIAEFRGKVEEAQSDSKTGVTKLETLIGTLAGLNQQLSTEAHNLTMALRGSSKTQGDWGEFILRDLLEKAGMREGEQYRFQESFGAEIDEDGGRGKASRTDVILNLPGNRHLVVDSKVSLVAYSDYCNTAAEDLRKSALKQHLISVRAHLEGLAKRKYHKLSGLESPDFVVMFIPIEPAFLLAMQEGGELWREAYQSNVLLVGPTTLLFVIRIVDNLWQQELQARNVADIVDRGTRLYEKFANFVADLTKVGDGLRLAENSYQNAMSKLSTGPGNLIKQTELLKKAGLRTNKQVPAKLLEAAGLDAEEQAELALAASAEESIEAE